MIDPIKEGFKIKVNNAATIRLDERLGISETGLHAQPNDARDSM